MVEAVVVGRELSGSRTSSAAIVGKPERSPTGNPQKKNMSGSSSHILIRHYVMFCCNSMVMV